MRSSAELQERLGLSRPPVAIAFFDVPPAGVAAWSGAPVPAGCVFWKRAQDGEVFYTVPSDHYNCAIGAYTHRIPLPAERAPELEQTVGFMVQNNYIAIEEVADIPTLPTSPSVIAYGPLDRAPFTPDLVLLTANPAQTMLLYEAAIKAGAGEGLLNALGRPACAVLPLTVATGKAAVSFGCMGNRTYTGLPDSEMYLCVPGSKWHALAAQLVTVFAANDAIGGHNRQRQQQFA
jgi:uncharacterized protein (DUF169 family)